MNVKDFLNLSLSKSFKLIAGYDGLENTISGVNILDNPNAHEWLSAGELIVTSGFFFKESDDIQDSFFKKFKDLNISAICIKEKVYFDNIPEHVIKLCNQLALPLIEIPYGIAFSKIMNTIMNALSHNINQDKQLAIDTQSTLFELVLNAGGLQSITNLIEDSTQNPLIILNADWELLSQSRLTENMHLPILKTNFATFFNREVFNELPDHLEQIKHPIFRSFDYQNEALLCCLFPIHFNTINYGFILIFLTQRPLASNDYIVLENASMSLALELVHQNEKNKMNNRLWREIFRQYISNHISMEEFIAQSDISFNLEQKYALIFMPVKLIHVEGLSLLQMKQNEQRLFHSLLGAIQQYLDEYVPFSYAFKQGPIIQIIYSSARTLSEEQWKKKINIFIEELIDRLQAAYIQSFEIRAVVGSNQPFSNLSQSYEEAEQLLSFLSEKEQSILFLDHLFFESFIDKHLSTEESQKYSQHYLLPLIQYDQKNKTDLTHTLRLFLENQGNITQSSLDLFIHRNTLLYRIDKIKQLLGHNLNDSTTLLALQLALYLYKP